MNISDGARLMRASFDILRRERALLWFPVISTGCLALVKENWRAESGGLGALRATLLLPGLLFYLDGKLLFVPIPGTTKLHRLEENLAAADVDLTDEELQEIETAAAQITPEGARYAEAQQRTIDR